MTRQIRISPPRVAARTARGNASAAVSTITRTAINGSQPLSLTAVEFDLLLSLAKACGRVKTRERLLLEVAERDFEAFDRSIDVHISSIRRKLGDDPSTEMIVCRKQILLGTPR